MTVKFYGEPVALGTIQMFDASAVRASCPDCGRLVDMPTRIVPDGHGASVCTPAPVAYDDEGDIFLAACADGHLWAYQMWDDSDVPD